MSENKGSKSGHFNNNHSPHILSYLIDFRFAKGFQMDSMLGNYRSAESCTHSQELDHSWSIEMS